MDTPAVITFIEKVLEVQNCCINSVYRDFPGDPVVKTLLSTPGWETKTPISNVVQPK